LSYVELLDLGDIVGLAKLFTRATVHTQGSAHELRGADAVTELNRTWYVVVDVRSSGRGEYRHFADNRTGRVQQPERRAAGRRVADGAAVECLHAQASDDALAAAVDACGVAVRRALVPVANRW
jgi:hypothetical protein